MSNQNPRQRGTDSRIEEAGRSNQSLFEKSQPPKNASANKTGLWISIWALFCGGVVGVLVYPEIAKQRELAEREVRKENVMKISSGIRSYHASYSRFPCTVSANSNGEETIGWRVALAPFLQAKATWNLVDSTQPWDSATNSQIASLPPEGFQKINAEVGETGMFAIVSRSTIFPPTPLIKLEYRDMPDGTNNTAILIELPNRSTPWHSNENLTPDEAYQAIQELDSHQVAHFIMGNGEIQNVGADMDRKLFDALISRNGGEDVDLDSQGD